MVSPAASLLAAYNGKATNTLGSNYGGYNPLSQQGTQGTQSFDPNKAAQSDVVNSQATYQNQQALAKSQLQASILPSSIGGGNEASSGSTDGSSQQGTSQDPFGAFNNAISTIQQRGIDQTAAVQNQAAQNWSTKLSGLTQLYNQNSANQPTWTDQDVQSILSKMPGYQQAAPGGLDYQQYVSSLPAGADPNSLGSRAVALAEQVAKNNVPYVWGGNSLTQGVDCSGLVQQVYARLGIQLPRTSTEQAKMGKIVPSLSQALPGDLILMYSPYEPAGLQQYGHVGIYIGNGQIVEAPGTGKNVRVGPIYNMTKIVRPW